jgi:hypothetical protein
MSALSLRQCLEQVAALGADYMLTDNQGIEWTATGLLGSLARDPDRLRLPCYFRLPDAQHDGAIYEVTQSGGFIRRYHIRHYPA